MGFNALAESKKWVNCSLLLFRHRQQTAFFLLETAAGTHPPAMPINSALPEPILELPMQRPFLNRLTFSAILLLGAQGAMAQSVYGELGYAAMSSKLSVPLIGLSATAKPTMARALVGVSVLGLSIEGIASGSLSSDNFLGNGLNATSLGKAEVSQILGVYVGSHLGLGPVEIFGRVGTAKSKVKFNGIGTSDDTDLSYGAGVRLLPAGNLTLSADYMNYLNKGGARIEGYTLSVGYKF